MFVDAPRAVTCCEESIALYRSVGDALGVARAQHFLGRALSIVGPLGAAVAMLHEARVALQASGAAEDLTWVLLALGNCALFEHDVALAERWVREALALSRQTGDEMGRGYALYNLGCVAHARGQRRANASRWGRCKSVAHARGQRHRALALLEEGVAVLETVGAPAAARGLIETLAAVLAEQGELDRATGILRDALTCWWDVGSKILLPALIEGLAAVATTSGQPGRAARLYGGAERLRRQHGPPVRPIEEATYQRNIARCQAMLPPGGFRGRLGGRGQLAA